MLVSHSAQAQDAIVFPCFPSATQVSRIAADGAITELPLAVSDCGNGELGKGSGDPQASPDGRYLAYIRDSNLWLRSLVTHNERRITAIATDQAEHYAMVQLLITAWSADSQRFSCL